MSTVTLEALEAKFSEIGAMLAAFKQTSAPTTYTVDAVDVELAPGEHYAGVVLHADGTVSHHLVLLPGSADDVTWQAAVEWAEQAGGKLPTRQEQALLYANLKGKFEDAWYWSSEAHATNGSFAWLQGFGYGLQYNDRKSYEGRACAVRLIRLTA